MQWSSKGPSTEPCSKAAQPLNLTGHRCQCMTPPLGGMTNNHTISHYVHTSVFHIIVWWKKKNTGASAWPQHWEEWPNGQHSLHPAPWALAQSAPEGSWPSGCFEWKSAGARSRNLCKTKIKQNTKKAGVQDFKDKFCAKFGIPLDQCMGLGVFGDGGLTDWLVDWFIDR